MASLVTWLLWPLALKVTSLSAETRRAPDWLLMATPAGASRDRVAVGDSTAREWPAGERIALVARDPLGTVIVNTLIKYEPTVD